MAILDLILGGAGGGIFGVVGGVANNYLKMKAQVQLKEIEKDQSEIDNKHQVAMLDKQAVIQSNADAAKLAMAEAEADAKVDEVKHNAYVKQLSGAWKWVQSISALIRPYIAWSIHSLILWICYRAMIVIDTTSVAGIEKYMALVAKTGIFSAYAFVICFYFTSRGVEKFMGTNKK